MIAPRTSCPQSGHFLLGYWRPVVGWEGVSGLWAESPEGVPHLFLYLSSGLGSRVRGQDALGEEGTGQLSLCLSIPICKMTALDKMDTRSLSRSENSRHM